jgi:Zn-dependent peptidase ImmA (M78 family)
MMLALAEVLGITSRFLENRFKSAVQPEQVHFRKQATTPLFLSSQVLARGTILDRFVQELGARVELPPVDFPDIPAQNLEDVERVAEEAREHWGLGPAGPIVSMTRVVENAGAIVTHFGGLSDRVDALSMDRPRPIIVRSSAKESACRLRFDLAHECGHLVMHHGIQTGDKETEDQAHRFASAFLLPRAGFVSEFPRGRVLDWQAIFELKLRWRVAARAIVRRAYDLGLITAAQYRTANIHLVKTGQAKSERYDDELPLEEPELLNAALDTLDSSCSGALQEITDEIGLDERMFCLITGRSLPAAACNHGSNVVALAKRDNS